MIRVHRNMRITDLPAVFRGQRAWLVGAVCLLGSLFVLALSAQAQPVGALSQPPGPAGCITERGSGGECGDGRTVDDPTAVAASPDGKSVYVASGGGDGIAVLQRSASGALTQAVGPAGCVTERGSGGACIDGVAVEDPVGIAVSPDNKSVYVASNSSDGVAAFARNTTTGALTQLAGTTGCVTDSGSGGSCAIGRRLSNPVAVTVSRDNRNVYVASGLDDGVAVFARNATTGALTQLAGVGGCITETGSGADCFNGAKLEEPTSLTSVGANVYVASNAADGVAVLRRNATTGALTQVTAVGNTEGCITERGSGGDCVDGKALDDPVSIATSADGKSVYVASDAADGVAVLQRNTTTGVLSQAAGPEGCVTERGTGGVCVDGNALEDPVSVEVTPDGNHAYVASNSDDAVAALGRNTTTGALTPLTDLACISERGLDLGCADGRALEDPVSLAISGDSRNVYVGAHASDGVAALTVKQLPLRGELTQLAGTQGCWSETGTAGECANGKALNGAISAASSPDGKHVYVASVLSDAVAVFNRGATTGRLTQLAGTNGCVSETGTGGVCIDGKALNGARSVTVSPDGSHVYVASDVSDAIAVFSRNSTTGALTQLAGTAGCVSLNGSGGLCTSGRALDGVRSVAVSANGAHVYATSFISDAVNAFSRNGGTGQLTPLAGSQGCVSETGTAGRCIDGKALDGASQVAVSPNGASLYVASDLSDAVAVFSRNTTNGQMSQLAGTAGCVSQTGTAGACADGKALDSAQGIAVSGDGKNVYSAALLSDAVAAFTRNTSTGALTQLAGTAGCVSETGAGPCDNGTALDGAHTVTLNPTGVNAYVGSDESDAVNVFSRNTTTGRLTQLRATSGCVSDDGSFGSCADGKALRDPNGLVVSPNGRNLYVASFFSDAVAIFARKP
jgi:6-phosphogluconolactonase (cycloisomerase 2 family)